MEKYVSKHKRPEGRQRELLVVLMEEAAEIIQATSKALRFGLEDGYPGTSRTNLGDLEREVGDLIAVVGMLGSGGEGLLRSEEVAAASFEKEGKLNVYLQEEN